MESQNGHISVLVSDIDDPFWGQVLEGLYQGAERLGIQLNIIYENLPFEPTAEEETALFDEIHAQTQELSVIVDSGMPSSVVERLLEAGATLVHMSETDLRHPRAVAPLGLYDAAQMAAKYLADAMRGQGSILMVGGPTTSRRAENGQSRINGFLDALKETPQISIQRVSTPWMYQDGYAATRQYLEQHPGVFNAIYGLSDTLTIAARDAARDLGCLKPETFIVGINGDPFALAAIASGKMSASVNISPIDLGRDAIETAYRIAQGQSVPERFPYKLRLVTAKNVHHISAEKLIAIAELPKRLVGFNRRVQQERLLQLETGLEINRRVGAILDLKQLSHEIAELIRTNYGYDEVQLYRWMSSERTLLPEMSPGTSIPFNEATPCGEAIQHDRLLFIANVQQELRFAPGTDLPDMQSRLVLPIHFSKDITHLLDLQSKRAMFHTRQDLIGLQLLADQFGIAIRNAELYSDVLRSREEALAAKAQAEKADNLKTRLLANVSHELRTPLNIIIGYSQSALSVPGPYEMELPEKLRGDLGHIYASGEHLIRLINDLLDLSRAEIDELDLFVEGVNPHRVIEEAFHSIADAPSNEKAVIWRLEIPSHLPVLNADPLRLKQVLLNLLSNARKFTNKGEITLGAEVTPPHLHLWVKDSGEGIPVDVQEHIFEPFVTAQTAGHRREGIGLGLTITRRLVALHGGSLSLESQPGLGSTFHIYLPLPSLTEETLPQALLPNAQPVVLFISRSGQISPALTELCQRQGLEPLNVQASDDLNKILNEFQPSAIAWDTAHAGPSDWGLIQKLRGHPQICQLPFLLYGETIEADTRSGTGMTNVLLKPVNSSALLKMINSFQPAKASGAILIIDDDSKTRELYQSMLASTLPGFEVVSLAGGAAALEYLSKESPSLVILDLMMPEVDGFRVLEFIRSQPGMASVPVVVISGQMLSYEDVKRLDYNRVLFQSKNVLSPTETAERLQQVLSEADFLPQPASDLVKRALAFIHQNFDRTFTLQEITYAVGVSKSYLSQIFRDEMGLPLWEYLNRYRVQKARQFLDATALPITEIAMRVGFDDFSYFGRVFNKYCGCSPRAYRQKTT
jgi:signal transduction histidine kinase/AraC-like DNA-binding protein